MRLRGFTLIELLIATGLLGVVVSLAFGLIWDQARVGREAALSAQEMNLALRMCESIRSDARRARDVKLSPDGSIGMTFGSDDAVLYNIVEGRIVRATSVDEQMGPRTKGIGYELKPESALLRFRIHCENERENRLLVVDCLLESHGENSK